MSRTLTFDLDELSDVAIARGAKVRDGQIQKLPYLTGLERCHGKGNPNNDGAEKWEQTLEVTDHSVATDMTPTRGFGSYNLATQKINRSFIFTPAFSGAPIVISNVEQNLNHGKNKILDRADTRAKNVMRYMLRTWHKHILSGAQPGFESWATLNGTDDTSGIIEEDAAGGNSYGGLDKGTLAAVPAMNNYVYDLADAVGQNGRLAVTKMLNTIDEFSEGDASSCIGLASPNGLVNLQRVMLPHMRYARTDQAVEVGGPKIMISGRVVEQTSHMPLTGTATTAAPWSVLWINCEDIYPCWLKSKDDGFFGMTEFREYGGDRRAYVAFVDCNGQMWVRAYNTSGLLHSGETF